MRKQIQAKIIGRVQLVMYRDFAERKAQALGITGVVKNMPDGSVFVIAEGDETKLKQYIKLLKKGPILARVEKVNVEWNEANGSYSNFLIKY